MKPKYIILFFVCFFGIAFLTDYLQTREEFGKSYNFVITKIELAPTYNMILYDNNEKILFYNFTIMNYEDVKIGDKVVRDKNSNTLRILRKNANGLYVKHLEFYSNNVI